MNSLSGIPSHVPAHLVRDFNMHDMGKADNIFDWFKSVQEESPDVFFTPHNGGHWVATRFEDIDYILTHPEEFSNRKMTIPPSPIDFTLVEYDGAKHADFRKLLQPFFTPKAVSALGHIVQELTVSLIEGLYPKGGCEFTSEFALKMPIIIVTKMLCELPDEDVPYLIAISEDMAHNAGDPVAYRNAFARCFEYFGTKIIPARRAKPGNDLISGIIHGKVEGGRSLTDDEILGFCSVLVGGGLDTVASELGFMTWFLANNPGHRQQLIDDPSLIPEAVEELLRRFPVGNFARLVVKDMEFKGVKLKAGEQILSSTSFAGLDGKHFPNSMTVDFRRSDKKHLSFGHGPHQCIGSYVARTELRIFLAEWLKRIPHFQVKQGERIRWTNGATNRISYLPITWNVE